MSKFRRVLVGLGLVAAVPALAFAASRTPDSTSSGCCEKKSAPAGAAADHTITCPITGEQIKESDCPLCKGSR